MIPSDNSRTVLAIGAHPDDVELGVGATLLQMRKAGWKIALLVATGGQLGGNPGSREMEQKKAATMLQSELFFGKLQDGLIPVIPDTVCMIEGHIRSLRPALVFVHWPQDTHQDHRNLAQASISASHSVENLVFYEGPSSEHFDPTDYGGKKGVRVRRDKPVWNRE